MKDTLVCEISLSSFDCSQTRVIFIEGCVSSVKSVHPTSIAVKHALFSSKNTCQHWDQFIQLRLQGNARYFHRRIRVDNDISSSNFDCNENGVIFIEYVSIVRSVHPTPCPQTDSSPAFHPSTRRKSPQQFHPLDPRKTRNPQPRVLPATCFRTVIFSPSPQSLLLRLSVILALI